MLKHRTSIVPSDLDNLIESGPADILLCHEAPSSHPDGVAEIDALAELLGVKLVVHGHHHESYRLLCRTVSTCEAWGEQSHGR
jgi:predicted phosphodiesterase